MELNDLKAQWNALDQRLAETEIVNMRMVKEMVSQKTKSAFNGIMGMNIYNLVVSLVIMGFVFPYVWMQTPISTTSFVIVEAIMLIGLTPAVRKLLLLSKFDVEGKNLNELSRLVLKYKKVCHDETFWTIVCVPLAFVGFYISELGFNTSVNYGFTHRVWVVAGLTLLTFAIAFVIGVWQRRRHASQMQEIENGLNELKEFES
jgi:heme exporter protein D